MMFLVRGYLAVLSTHAAAAACRNKLPPNEKISTALWRHPDARLTKLQKTPPRRFQAKELC